jgi:bifunctional non-homologous end joining protein LigD
MPLDTYQRMRDFGKTPEPAGAPGDGTGRYVVQRHRATALHWDFRLEIDGVLVSWAVPKGPTLDPAQRRMAIHVEDHPIEYFDFEGVIPEGQYGAGDVIVWDWGTFTPEETDDPGRAVAKGELKFRLDGEKLHGRFTIVRTEGRGRGSSDDGKEKWLLIHKRDAAAVDGWDAEDHPRSVKSGRTNDEVRDGVPAIWQSDMPAREAEIDLGAARAETLPDFVPPMKATLADGAFSSPDWLYEVKWDGYRVEAVVRDGRVRLWTRNHKDAATYFPEFGAAPASWIAAKTAIVDGEMVALDEDGNPSFSLLQDRTGLRGINAGADGRRAETRPSPEERRSIPLVYQAFDLLHLDGRSLLDVPLEQRKRLLQSVLRGGEMVQYAGHVTQDGEAFVAAARDRGLEGVVAKLRASRYEPGRRSPAWLKIKLRREQELVVGGWLPGKGSHKDLGSLIVGVYESERLVHAGQVGSGIDARMRRELLARFEPLRRETPPFDPAPRLKEARWVEPRVVIRAEFAEWTRDNLLRQAAFKGLEIGKDARNVHRERPVTTSAATRRAEAGAHPPTPQPRTRRAAATPRMPAQEATPAELKALDAMQRQGSWSVGGHELRLTNLDKVLFPAEGRHRALTKRDLIRHYVRLAPVLLPHLTGRALNLQRFPDGTASGRGFWQKDVPGHAPEWVQRTTYAGSEGTKDYVVADRVATLAWLAQEAAVELHPWTSRADAPDRPTFALIDIDPGTDTTWGEVLVLARLYRTALDHLRLTGLPKVTGKRGIQIWVPIAPRYSFDETRDWVEALSRAVGQTVPDLISWEWAKRARSGRARLDFTQNAINRTLIAPYSARPASGAPVSTPIRWEELDDPKLRPDRWTITNIGRRVGRVGDLFAAAQELEQELPAL